MAYSPRMLGNPPPPSQIGEKLAKTWDILQPYVTGPYDAFWRLAQSPAASGFEFTEQDAADALTAGGGVMMAGSVVPRPAASIGMGGRVPLSRITKSPASPAEYIERGSVMYRYSDPETGGYMDIVTRPTGARNASVIGLEVPEEYRGLGVGKALQDAVLNDFPSMMGQVSSKAAAVNAYKRGRRPISNPNATLEDVFRMIDEDSSVNLATVDKQKGGR